MSLHDHFGVRSKLLITKCFALNEYRYDASCSFFPLSASRCFSMVRRSQVKPTFILFCFLQDQREDTLPKHKIKNWAGVQITLSASLLEDAGDIKQTTFLYLSFYKPLLQNRTHKLKTQTGIG